jgi:hypothetical protein
MAFARVTPGNQAPALVTHALVTPVRIVLLWAAAIVAVVFSTHCVFGAPSSIPDPAEIVHRVTTTWAASHIVSADVGLRLYVHKPVSSPPPDCTFSGKLHVEQGSPIIQLGQRSPGATCAIVERRGLGPLFRSLEPLETFLGRFDLSVVDQKLEGNDHYYRVQGKAHDPKGDPHGFIAWIDYDLGVIPEGTINYGWGDMDTQQIYDRINNAPALTRQVLYSPRYNASLELVYTNFEFAP